MRRASAPQLATLPAWYRPKRVDLPRLVEDFMAQHVDGEGLEPQTRDHYVLALGQWLAWCAEQHHSDPRAISPEILGAYQQHLRTRPARPPGGGAPRRSGPTALPRTLSDHTVARYLRAVRALFSWAELHGYVELSPFRRYRIRSPRLPVARGFTEDEVRRILEATYQQSEHARRDRAIVLLLWDTMARREEVCGLRLDDVLDGGRRIARSIVVRGKFDKERRLELHPQTQRALLEYLAEERPDVPTDAVFVGRYGDGLAPEGLSTLIRRLCRRAGLKGPRLSPHSFRHGATRAYLESDGARIDDLQILLGHESVQMSLHYAGQVAAQARRGARSHSPVGRLGLALGRRLQRGRPRKPRPT